MPLWTFTPLTPTTLHLSETSSFEVKYSVRNHSPKSKQLTILPLQGIKQIAPCRLAPKGQPNDTCILQLAISGKELPAEGVNGGPSLCQINPDGSPNMNQCYRPNASQSLNITRGSAAATATITVNPTSLNFVAGHNGMITVVNNAASSASANNVQAIMPVGSNITVQTTTCGASLAIGGSCTITFTSPVAEGLTHIVISGSNTKTVSVGVTVTATPTATISVSPVTLQFVKSSTAFVTVTNTGGVVVTGVAASIPVGSNIEVVSAATTCGASLAIGANCKITFTSSVAEGPINVSISGTNADINTEIVAVTVTETPVAILEVEPTSLVFSVGSSGSVQVKNLTAIPAQNVAATIPLGSNIIVDSSDCGAILTNAIPCTIVFSSASLEGPTIVPIAGDNTDPADVSITVVPLPTISISDPSPNAFIVPVSGGDLTLKITNNGAIEAKNITVSEHSNCPDLQFEDTDCSTVPGGDGCSLILSSPTPYIPCRIVISGTNTDTSTNPKPNIAFQAQGGIVYSTQNGRVSVVDESDQSSSVWGTMGVDTFASSIEDGLTNTSQIVSALGGAPSAAQVCDDLVSAGFNDWYLPAICEWGRRSGTDPSPGCSIPFDSTVYNLKQLGFINLSSSDYWSSTEYSVAPPAGSIPKDDAWSQSGNTGSFSVFNKDSNQNVRCVRSY